MHRIVDLSDKGDLREAAREIVAEYMLATGRETGAAWAARGELPPLLASERDDLDSVYRRPGGFLVALTADEPSGCAGLRAVDARRAAIRRLYVRPARRGLGLGRRLMDACVDRARAAGFESVVLDVLPSRTTVVDWYLRQGFSEIEPYERTPVPMTFLGRALARRP